MASQPEPGYSETASKSTQNEPTANARAVNASAKYCNNRTSYALDLMLRVLAVGATLAAAIVMGKSKQTEPVLVVYNNVRFYTPVPAKYHYSPAFVFFVVANGVACGYALLSIVASVFNLAKSRSSNLCTFLLSLCDLVTVALLSSGASAATAIGYVGLKGNSHTGWAKICNTHERFCHHVAGAVASSFVGVIIFISLTAMSTYILYKRTR